MLLQAIYAIFKESFYTKKQLDKVLPTFIEGYEKLMEVANKKADLVNANKELWEGKNEIDIAGDVQIQINH